MSRFGAALWAISFTLPLTMACGGPPPPADVEPLPGPGAVAEPAVVLSGESAFGVGTVEHLPADTEIVLMAKSPRALLETLRYPELRERHAALFAEAAAESIRELAEDFTSVSALETVGVDLNAPAGFAWLNSEAEAGCLFGGLRDAGAFRKWVVRASVLQRTELSESQQGDAVVFRPAGHEDVALIVHPDRFTFVFVDRERHAPGIIGRLTRMTPDESLASAPAFRRLLGYRLAATDLTGYVGVQSALTHLIEAMRGQHVPIASDVVAGVFGVSIGAGAKLDIDAVLDLKSGSLLRAAMVEGPTPHVFRAQIDAPALVIGGHVAHDRLGAAFDEILRIERDPERERRQIEEALGLDLHRQVAKALTGELGIAVRTDATSDAWSRERVTISAGLEDDGGQALVDQLKRVAGDNDEPTIERQGAYLVVSDDAETIARLRKPEPQGRLPKGIEHDGFFAPGASAWLRLDATLVASEVFHIRAPRAMSVASPPPPPPGPSKSAQIDALDREIAALQTQIDERIERSDALEDEPARGAARRAGSTLLRFSLEGDAVRVRGVQALDAASLAALVERAFAEVSETEARQAPLEAEVRALFDKRRDLEQKREELLLKQQPR